MKPDMKISILLTMHFVNMVSILSLVNSDTSTQYKKETGPCNEFTCDDMNGINQLLQILDSKFRLCSSEALVTPTRPDGCEKSYPPKIVEIADQISKLTLIEAAELNECLQCMGAMPMFAAPAGEKVTRSFTVTLTDVDSANKIALIKAVRNILGIGLKEAKEFVESGPQIIKSGVGKDEAKEIKQALEEAGATSVIS